MNAAILFSVSLLFISLELYFTRILNLKTWNHVVYIIIPFAILGYGVGANVCLLARPLLKTLEEQKVLYWSLLLAGALEHRQHALPDLHPGSAQLSGYDLPATRFHPDAARGLHHS